MVPMNTLRLDPCSIMYLRAMWKYDSHYHACMSSIRGFQSPVTLRTYNAHLMERNYIFDLFELPA